MAMTSAKYSTQIDSVAVGATIGNSDPFNYGDFEKGMVFIPTGSAITTLTWHASNSERGTYLPVNNASGAVTQTVSQGKAYPIPTDVLGARFLKITGDAAGVVGVSLKD